MTGSGAVERFITTLPELTARRTLRAVGVELQVNLGFSKFTLVELQQILDAAHDGTLYAALYLPYQDVSLITRDLEDIVKWLKNLERTLTGQVHQDHKPS